LKNGPQLARFFDVGYGIVLGLLTDHNTFTAWISATGQAIGTDFYDM
jgi:hypothetical protein